MMRALLTMAVCLALAPSAAGQWYAPSEGCANGRCPIAGPAAPVPSFSQPALPGAAAGAIVRVTNAGRTSQAMGTGTLVDGDAQSGLVLTCAHLFRDGRGTIGVTFPDRRTLAATLVRIDATADLAALSIAAPRVDSVVVATEAPRRGDPLVSCGYGTDGRLWCNRGQALGYVTASSAYGHETLELSGAARFGDSGGPVFNRDYELVAVLFGSNGRVVDGTFCGRIRRFLAGLSPRFGGQRPDAPPGPAGPSPPAVEPSAPLVDVPPPGEGKSSGETSPAVADRLAKLEQLVARVHSGWQGLTARVDTLTDLVKGVRQAIRDQRGDQRQAPPEVELPPAVDSLDPIADAARPWLSGRLATLLVSLGVPGGIAGVAAGALVYVVMRRAQRRLRGELARMQARLAAVVGEVPPMASAGDDAAVVERHHNRYVPYEVTALDKAWAAAHARIGERYPGAVPYLKMAEGVKDQLLSGNDNPVVSEGRVS